MNKKVDSIDKLFLTFGLFSTDIQLNSMHRDKDYP